MRVPTYTSQSAIPRQTAAQPLDVQLSTSAMTAPGRAYADAGATNKQSGKQALNFGVKLFEASAENEAAKHTPKYKEELSAAKAKYLKFHNLDNAQKEYDKAQKLIHQKYRSKMSFGASKRKFDDAVRDHTVRERIDFRKKNNTRIIQVKTGILDGELQNANEIPSNLDNSAAVVSAAKGSAATQINKAFADGVINGEEYTKRQQKLEFDFAHNRLLAHVNNPNEKDPIGFVERFLTGQTSKKYLQESYKKLTAAERQKIGDAALKTANKRIKGRLDGIKLRESQEASANNKTFRQIVNADLSNPEEKQAVEEAHARLVNQNFYKTRAQKLAIDRLLEADGFAEEGNESLTDQATLESQANLGELTLEMLNESRDKITYNFYRDILKKVTEPSKSDTRNIITIAEQRLAASFNFEKHASEQYSRDKNPIIAAHNQARVKLLDYVNLHQGKPGFDPVKEAKDIYEAQRGDYLPQRLLFLKEQFKSIQSSISGGQSFGNIYGDDLKVIKNKIKAKLARNSTTALANALKQIHLIISTQNEIAGSASR